MGNPSLFTELGECGRCLHDPEQFGARTQLQEKRGMLKKWIKLWALVSCVLSLHDESTTQLNKDLVMTMRNIPDTVHIKMLALSKGALHAFPMTCRWNEEHSGDTNKHSSNVTFRMSGAYCGTDVGELKGNLKKTDLTEKTFPGLCEFITDQVSFDDDAGIEVRLLHRGSLLETDEELRAWRARVRADAERAEQELMELTLMTQHDEIKCSCPVCTPRVESASTDAQDGGDSKKINPHIINLQEKEKVK